MSAGVSDQRMKGQGNQVANGPKEHVNEHEDFDSWRTQHHQGYNSTPISTTSMGSDPYTMTNFYGTSTFPYQAFGVGDGTWSNGDQMTFLSGYTGQMGHDSYGMDGMFGGGGGGFSTTFSQPGFNYFHGNGDFSTWGSSPGAMARKPHYDEYYRPNDAMYGTNVEGMKAVEHGMQGLGLSDVKVIDGKELAKQQAVGVAQQQELLAKDVVPPPQQSAAPKKMTWASVASQPAKPQPPVPSGGLKKKGPGMPPPPMVLGKHNMDFGTWEGKNGAGLAPKAAVGPPPQAVRSSWGGPVRGGPHRPGPPGPSNFGPVPAHTVAILPPHIQQGPPPQQPPPPHPSIMSPPMAAVNHPVLEELRVKNNYNPTEYDLLAEGAKFFVIKSYSEDDIHRSIKYEIWCSTEHGNKRLDSAYRERESKGGVVYLFFSVNGSGHFCGMAQMTSPVDYHASSSVWSQDKWKGQFHVRWIYVKDVPNTQLRHIRLENNENKPVTNSRDTQEVPFEKGRQVLRIMHTYRHTTSIFDDFIHYEKRQEEEDSRKVIPSNNDQDHPKERGERGGDRGDRNDRNDRGDRGDRGDRSDRGERRDRGERNDRDRDRGGNRGGRGGRN